MMRENKRSTVRAAIEAPREGGASAARVRAPLTLDTSMPGKAAKDDRGSDPYNTSGSFDRKKNWARVGKR